VQQQEQHSAGASDAVDSVTVSPFDAETVAVYIHICQYVVVIDCCSPIFGSPIDDDQASALARRFKALSDPGRLRLLSLIARCGEMCGCEPVKPLGLSQPTVSHHLKVLHEAGLIARERRGRWIYYRVIPEAVSVLVEALAIETRVPAGA